MVTASSDPFGIFPTQYEIPSRQHVVVLPYVANIRSFNLPSGRLPGGEALRQRTHQVTPNASTVRDYVHGDSLSRIHWKSTAKRRRLIVKEFELDPLAEIWILLDSERAVQFERPPTEEERVIEVGEAYRLPPSTFEYSVAAATSLAMHFLERDRATGLISYGHVRHISQPETGDAQQFRILESLAVVEDQGELSLQDVLKIEGLRIPQGATVVLVTSSGSDAMVAAVRQLMHAGRQPMLILVDPASFGASWSVSSAAETARRTGIPVRTLRFGDDLGEALSDPRQPSRKYRAA
jgi:uncharacterized protein (DUF58 family)